MKKKRKNVTKLIMYDVVYIILYAGGSFITNASCIGYERPPNTHKIPPGNRNQLDKGGHINVLQ